MVSMIFFSKANIENPGLVNVANGRYFLEKNALRILEDSSIIKKTQDKIKFKISPVSEPRM